MGVTDVNTMLTTANVQGIVLAGVHAWGESALEQICPRPLLPVVGRPLTWYVLDWLRRGGITHVSICANSDTHLFRRCLGNGALRSVRMDYYADLMPRGPAGCIRDAAAPESDTLLVVEASVATRIDASALLEAHWKARAALTVVTAGSGAAAEPVGIYVLSRSAVTHIRPGCYQDIKEMLIPRLYANGEVVMAYPVEDRQNLQVRDAASYLAANSWALEGSVPAWTPPHGYCLLGQAYVHETARMAKTVRLVGPVVVGPGCYIDDGVTLVGATTLGARCRIGTDAVISRAAVWPDCQVEPGAIIDHCVLVQDSLVESACIVRDTVCLPRKAGALDVAGSYWALEAPYQADASALNRLLTAGHVQTVPAPTLARPRVQGSMV
jgi:NDP-sugar pyrophosphorylase family protein